MARVVLPNRRTSAFLGIGFDFFRHPYKRQFLPRSRIITDDPTTEQDFEWRIHPKDCVRCQSGQILKDVNVMLNYNMIISYALETRGKHGCPQRANEKTTIALVVAKIISAEFPSGQTRFFATQSVYERLMDSKSKLIKKENQQRLHQFEELGHWMDHAATIFADAKMYELLRHTPVYTSRLEDLRLSTNVNEAVNYPFENDPMVPRSLQQWNAQYMKEQKLSFMKSMGMDMNGYHSGINSGHNRGINSGHNSGYNSGDNTTTTSTTTTKTKTTVSLPQVAPSPVAAEPIASLNPQTDRWVKPPDLLGKIDWESEPSIADDSLIHWTYDPVVHDVETQYKKYSVDAKARHKSIQSLRLRPSFLPPVKESDDDENDDYDDE